MKNFTIIVNENSAVAISDKITPILDLHQLAAQTGISVARLSYALRGEKFSKHLPSRTLLTEQEKEAIRILRNVGFTQAQIMNATGRSMNAVLRTVGRQPKEVSVRNRLNGKKLSRMKAENALRMIVEADPSMVAKKIG